MSFIDDIIARMILASGAKNAAEMSKIIGFSTGAVSQWKKRGSIPKGSIARAAARTNVRYEWIETGEGKMHQDVERVFGGMVAETSHAYLTEEQRRLLDAYASADEVIRRAALRMLEESAKESKGGGGEESLSSQKKSNSR